MVNKVAGIDVHKKMLMVVVRDPGQTEQVWEPGRFGTTTQELRRLAQRPRRERSRDGIDGTILEAGLV